jgi:hypothetical protein
MAALAIIAEETVAPPPEAMATGALRLDRA